MNVGDLPWVRIPPGPSVARPEAIRAMKEVTNSLKYSVSKVTWVTYDAARPLRERLRFLELGRATARGHPMPQHL